MTVASLSPGVASVFCAVDPASCAKAGSQAIANDRLSGPDPELSLLHDVSPVHTDLRRWFIPIKTLRS